MLLIMFSPDCFCISGLLSFFPLPYTAFLGAFMLKRLTTSSLRPPTNFLAGLGI